MKQVNDQLYRVTQVLIEFWDTINEIMKKQNIDINELHFRTGIETRELEDYTQNYANAPIPNIIKIATALDKTITIKLKDIESPHK